MGGNKRFEFREGNLLVAVPICGIKHGVSELGRSLHAQHLSNVSTVGTSLNDGKQVNGEGTKLSTG